MEVYQRRAKGRKNENMWPLCFRVDNRAESKGQKQTPRCINGACDNIEARKPCMLGQATQQSVKKEKK